jgi:S-formylglutathione hydrolase FrmB
MARQRAVVRRFAILFLLALLLSGPSGGMLDRSVTALRNLRQITLYSPALQGVTHVDVLLPPGYATSARRYPVLYLLHGVGGSYLDWMQNTDIARFARGLPLLIVMPDGGDGWYADPLTVGPRWETYHIKELIPYIDRHFRTVATRNGRAVAGLSMGGFGAFSYAARHPDLFVAAASFSGALNPRALEGLAGIDTAFGTHSARALRAHSPIDLVKNLRGMRLFLSAGNGKPGLLDPSHSIGTDPLEQAIHSSFVTMVAALRAAHIPAMVDNYGNGTHTWPYWQRELHRAMPMLLAALAQPPAPVSRR